MIERHPPPRDPRIEEVAEWHPIEGSPETGGAGCTIAATTIETYGFIGSGDPGAC